MARLFLVIFLMPSMMLRAAADDQVLPSAALRFADDTRGETPDFQRHVVPLLGRLGCNGRACHGSFQGKGGFRLSLFGYDFAADHKALTSETGDSGERRIRAGAPDESLLLQKPTLVVDHEGGERLRRDGWEYRLLRRWIEAGAAKQTRDRRLLQLEVTPNEIVSPATGASTPLRAVATWDDGTREDVSCLCRFQSNDDSVAEVDSDGNVAVVGSGDTHVIVFYDNGVASVPVVSPFGEPAAERDMPAAATQVDELVLNKLRKLGVTPSELCTDAEFLRRASIDMTGTLPTPDEVTAFLADPSSDKRARKIDELLETPAYAAWWTNKLCDYTGNSPQRQAELGQEFAVQWYSWMFKRVTDNVPYDELMAGVVQATSRPAGQSYEHYVAEMSACFRESDPADFATRDSLPHFWSRRSLEKPEEKALAFAHTFLGVRLDCAQCHKHPYDQWTQADFKEFAGLFASVRYGVAPDARDSNRKLAQAVGQRIRGDQGDAINKDLLAMAQDGKSVPWRELYVDEGKVPRGSRHVLGYEVDFEYADPRRALMQWLRRDDNPYFARAFVNRVWANYFHVGIVDPPDDLNLANPPSNRELLDYLAAGFIDSNFDMKWLHREITSSGTYQRSWKPNSSNEHDRRNFSRFIPRRIPAEVVYDALKQVTAADTELIAVREDVERKASGHLSTLMAGTYAMNVFGKPERTTECDCERVNTPTLLQSVFLQNDPLIQIRLAESGWLKDIDEATTAKGAADVDRSALVRAAYLRTLCRLPTGEEVARATSYLEQSGSTRLGVEDLVWALVNSKEFILNH